MNEDFMNDLVAFRSPLLIGGYDFLYKDEIRGSIARFDKEINIQFIESKYPGKGNVQKFIKLWKKDCEDRGFTLVSSTPISPAWEHIANKFNIKIYK